MKNKIIALLIMLLIPLSFVPVSSQEQIQNVSFSIVGSISEEKILHNELNTDLKLRLTNSESTQSTVQLEFDKMDMSDDIDFKYRTNQSSTSSEVLTVIVPGASEGVPGQLEISIEILASENQWVSLDEDTLFGADIVAIENSLEVFRQGVEFEVGSEKLQVKMTVEEDELEPDDTLELEVDVDHIWDEDLDIDNIQYTIVIQNLDSGDDDIEVDSDDFDLQEGDDDNQNFDIDIPLNVDEKTFDILLENFEFEDEDNEDYEIKGIYRNAFDVEKNNREEVKFERVSLPTTLQCGANLIVDAKAVNTGTRDLDDMYLEVEIDELGLTERTSVFDLESDDGKDRDTTETISISFPRDTEPGSYTIKVWAYNEDDEPVGVSSTEQVTISCGNVIQDNEEDNVDTTGSNNNNVNTQNTNDEYFPTFTSGNFFEDNGSTIFWIIADIVLILVAIYFIVLIARKRK